MSGPKSRFKGLLNLGAAIDARIRAITNRMVSTVSTPAASVPISGGGSAGGSGAADEPAFPESWVASLRESAVFEALSGPLVLSGAGDTTIAQAATAPHFTVASPQYRGADGVVRVGDAFCADTTVVRTAGAQDIAGQKRFAAFPWGPDADPTAERELAPKRYVDARGAALELQLAALSRQVFPAAGGPGETQPLLASGQAAYPAGALPPLDFTASAAAQFSFPSTGGAAQLASAVARYAWTSEAVGGAISRGAALALGTLSRRWGERLLLRARLMVETPQRFSAVHLSLCDHLGNSATGPNIAPLLLAGVWHEALLGVDARAWDSCVHACLSAQGTADPLNSGATALQVEYLALEQTVV